MRHGILPACAAVALAVAVVATAPRILDAHEKGVLKLANRELMAGDSVRLAGEKFTPRGALTLFLTGVRGRIRLDQVRADTGGAFALVIRVPTDLAPGAYRLVAVAADGDEVAALDVSVVAHGAGHGPAAAGHEGDGPSAAPLVLDRARSPWVTVGAVAMIALALVSSGMLLRRPVKT